MKAHRGRSLLAAVLTAVGVALTISAGLARAATAPAVVTGAAAPVTDTQATIAGTVDPNGTATTWHVEFGTTTSYGSVTTSSSAGSGDTALDVSALLSGLQVGTTYHYRLVATSSAGTTNGTDATFTTLAPPVPVTGAASAAAPTTVTLAGTVDPRSRATTWVFEYGLGTGYGSITPSRSAGSGNGPVDVSATISGLTPGQTYHYRISATSDVGTAKGADRTFSTGSAPRATTGAASAVGPTTATVAGTVNPLGLDTTWYVDYGTSTSYGSRTALRSAGAGSADVAVSAALSGLKAGTTYHYRVAGSSAAGTGNGADRTFTTVAGPDARTGPASAVTAAGATLTGSVDARGRATTWWFEYGTTTGYGSRTSSKSAVTKVGDQNVSAAIGGLRTATTYHFRLVATNDAGTTTGSDQSFSTGTPPVPSTGAALVSAGGTVTFAGVVQPNGVPTSWWFEYGTSTGYGTRTPTRSAGSGSAATTVAESVTNAPAGSLLHYRLVVSSDAGTSAGKDASVRVGAQPAALTGATAAVTAGGGTVTGMVTPNGLATTWWFDYGPTQSYGSHTSPVVASGGAAEVRALITGQREGAVVHYRLVARNAAGTSTGADRAFLTPALPRTPSGQPVRCTITGTPGRDVLRGTSHKDVICGLGGDDVIYGNGGSDVIYSGDGNDVVYGGDGNDVIFAGVGDDRIDGGYGNDTIDAGPGNDTVLAGPGRDTVVAGSGQNSVNGGPGLDCAVVRGGQTALVSAGVCPKRR